VKKKPLSVRIISILFLLAPIGNLMQLAYFNGWPYTGPRGVIYRLGTYEWIILAMFPIVAFGIWRVATWGYFLCMSFAAFLIVNNTYAMFVNQRAYSPYIVLLFQLVTFASIGLLLHSHFAAPYFNPRMRWWETERRYRVSLKGQLRAGQNLGDCEIVDISLGGCFITTQQKLQTGDEVMLRVATGEMHVTAKCQVVWVRSHEPGYGLMFKPLAREDKKTLKKILTTLTKHTKKSVADDTKSDSILSA
jgi:Tfp pilus assembly protein PilZ